MDANEKLLARMQATQSGWTVNDLESLYVGFGFDFEEGGSHRKYSHPEHRELYAVVPRHRTIKPNYIRYALKTIRRLKEMEHDNATRE